MMGEEAPKPLWRCPRCGHELVTRNLWHSCGRYRLEDHFEGRSEKLRWTFDALVEAAERLGSVTVYAQKSRIVLQERVRFANLVVRRDWLDLMLWLGRRVEHPLLHRIESFGRLGFGLHFKLRAPDDLDAALRALLAEAHARGLLPPSRRDRPQG